MALTIGDNFSYLGAKPLDGRLKYDTISAMVGMSESTLYDGIMAYCVEDGKEYQWKSTNTSDPTLGKWREFKTDVPTAYTGTPEMDGTGAAGSSTSWAKGDHVHPSDTTKADVSTVNGILNGTTLDSFGDVETALADKADKVSSATSGVFAALDSNGNLTDSGKAPSDLTGITTIAPAFDATATYNIGDRCTYNGAFYKFTAAHTGAWVAVDATEVTVDGEIPQELTAAQMQAIKDAFEPTVRPDMMPVLFDETGAERVVAWYKLANGTKKPVYRKDISIGDITVASYTPYDFSTATVLDNEHIDEVLDISGGFWVDYSGASKQYLSWNVTHASANSVYGYTTIYKPNNKVIRIQGTWGSSSTTLSQAKVTILYTKTTDTPI